MKQASKKGVDLTWTKNSSKNQVSYYTVYRDGVAIGISKTASVTDENVSENTTYQYQISAINSIGESEKTEVLVVEVPVGEPEPEYPEWVINHAYNAGDFVSYKENIYKCIQPHESNEGWAPDLAPTLWELVVE